MSARFGITTDFEAGLWSIQILSRIHKQRDLTALNRKGTRQQRPELPVVTPPGVWVNTEDINSTYSLKKRKQGRKHGALRPQKPLRLIRDGEVGGSGILYLTRTRYIVTTRMILHKVGSWVSHFVENRSEASKVLCSCSRHTPTRSTKTTI